MSPDQALWLIGWAYVVANTGRVFSYLPQIAVIWRCSDGAMSISLLTWSYWAVSHLTACLYAGIVIDDGKLLTVSVANLACCTTVVVLATLRRRQHRRRSAEASRVEPARTATLAGALRRPQ